MSGSCDYIEDLAKIKRELPDAEGMEGDKLDKRAREVAEQKGIERAKKEAIDKGGYSMLTFFGCSEALLVLSGKDVDPQ